jgi:mercuric ion binding protein
MLNKNIYGLLIAVLLLSIFQFSKITNAQTKIDENGKKYVKVEVDGLACPFCAYGLEKKLLQIDGADDFKVNIDSAYATLTIPGKSKVTKEEIKQIVKDAGFSATIVLFSDKPFKN